MNCMSKIGVIGHRDAVLGFQAAGLDVFPVTDAQEAAHTINRLAAGGYAVLFVTEQIAQEIPETVKRYKAAAYPALIPIPGTCGSTGYGMAQVRQNMEKAVGADIFDK